MSQQYNLYNNNIKSVPNIYFLGTSKDNQYDTSNQTQNYINPNSIKNNCQNQASNQSSFLINSSNDEDENLMTRENNYNNFLWRYATNRLNDNTTVKLSDNKTTSYSEIQEGAKNQLEYLGCQVLKDSNKIYDQSGMSLYKIDQKTGAMGIALIIFIALNFSFIAKSFFNEKSSFITLFSKMSEKINCKIVGIIGFSIAALFIGCLLCWLAVPVSGNENEKKGINYLLFNNIDSEDITAPGLKITTCLIILVLLIIITIIFTFRKIYHKISDKVKYCALFIPLFVIALVYTINYTANSSIAKHFTVSDSTTNTCKNIEETETDNTRIVGYLFLFYFISLIGYFALVGFNKNNLTFPLGSKGFFGGVCYMFGILTPLLLLMFECSFALLQPILYFFVIILIRISVYLFSLVNKSKITAVLFNYPESYFDKMKDSSIKINYPTTLPSGASWNTVSILIFKIVFLIVNKTSGGKIQASDFNFFNSLDA